MKKGLLAVIVILFISAGANAQCGDYTLTVLNQTYQPLLTGAKNFAYSVWDDTAVTLQLGFKFVLNGDTTKLFTFQQRPTGQGAGVAHSYYFSGFMQTDADLVDRGKNSNHTHLSPVRYRIDSTSGGHIFKAEVYNAGFMKDTANDDYTSLQIWWYENSNIVELWYGPSNITHAGSYFTNGAGPLIGYLKDYSGTTSNFTMFYYYKGAPNAPVLDSVSNISAVSGGLNAYPAAGTVYRFTPYATGIKSIKNAMSKIKLINTVCTDELDISSDEETAMGYQMISLNGAIVTLRGSLVKGSNKIDVGAIPPGMYVLQLNNGSDRWSLKFIKL